MTVNATRAKSIFLAASELPNIAQRAEFLAQHCGSDGPLRMRVEALLRAHDAADSIEIEPLVQALEVTIDAPLSMLPGTLIASRYKLLEAIGEGGMGTVWLAEQKEPVKRKVALKLVKAGMDSRAVLARFEAERQALAMMDHPNIAKVLDGGATEQGRPYFVMELVKGIPLTEYCDQLQFTIRERLELFGQVCSAVQHAHQKGIIHRDLKPSNVLVTEVDGRPVVKVIDFGLAKALHGSQVLTDQSLHTAFGAVLGTPLYMAPEQLGTSALDVDTRADLYSLGVILYELLTGTTPIERQQMKQAAFEEMCRLIREQEPPRPSTRLSSSDSLPSLAVRRHAEPAKLTRLVRGELDWIVMKALDKDRNRRYETANGLAMEVQRYLAGEAVLAAPPSRLYRLQKFIRRNRGTVLTACLLILLLVGGTISTSLAMLEARRQMSRVEKEVVEKEAARVAESEQRKKAEAAEQTALRAAESERQARELEQQQREFAEAINRFVVDDFLALTSVEGQERFEGNGLDRSTTAFELLERAANKLKSRNDLDPRIEAERCWIVGVNYHGAGEAAKGIPFLERAVELRTAELGEANQESINAMNSLAMGLSAAGQVDRAAALFERCVELGATLTEPTHPNNLTIMSNLASAYLDLGYFEKALSLSQQTLDLHRELLGNNHIDTLRSMNNLAIVYGEAGNNDKALELLEQTKTRLDQLAESGISPLLLLTCMNNLASGYRKSGQFAAALELVEKTLELCKEKHGPDHPFTLGVMHNLAMIHCELRHSKQGELLLRETWELQSSKLGPDHPQTLQSLQDLAGLYRRTGKFAKALPLLQQVLELRKEKLGSGSRATLESMRELGAFYLDNGQASLAIPLLEETLEFLQSNYGNDDGLKLDTMDLLGRSYIDIGETEKGVPLLKQAYELVAAKLGLNHRQTIAMMSNLAFIYQNSNEIAKAIPMLEKTLEFTTAEMGIAHYETLVLMNNLAEGYRNTGQVDKALPLIEKALEIAKPKLGSDDPLTLAIMNNVGTSYWDLGRLDQSVPLFETLLQLNEEKFGRQHPETQWVVGNLGCNYLKAGRVDAAILLLEECVNASSQFPNLSDFRISLLDAYVKGKRKSEFLELAESEMKKARKNPRRYRPILPRLLLQISGGYLEFEMLPEAEQFLSECLEIRQDSEPNLYTTFNTQATLGGVRIMQAKSLHDPTEKMKLLAATERLLVSGYEGMKEREASIPPQGATRIPEALDRLIELYGLLDKPAELEKYRQLRAEYAELKQ